MFCCQVVMAEMFKKTRDFSPYHKRQDPQPEIAYVLAMQARGATRTAPLAAAALAAMGVDFVMVGGCALVLRGEAHRCTDLDIVPRPDIDNVDQLTRAIAMLTHEPLEIRAHERIASVRSPYGRIDVCIATAHEEFEGLQARADEIAVATTRIRVACTPDVLRLRERFAA
jgi:hypothetical protein